MSKLRIAAMEGDLDQVSALLKPDSFRSSRMPIRSEEQAEALNFAAARGHCAVVRQLLEAGAPVNQIFPGGSALHAAVMGNYPEVVDTLLEAGADPDLSDRSLDARKQGWTALMYAACYGRTAIAHQLLNAGATADLKDRDGQTPLMIAANAGHTTIALLLLEAGAQLTDQDHYGNTALACALAHDSHCDAVTQSLAQSLAEKAALSLDFLAAPPVPSYHIIRDAKLRPWNWESIPSGEDRNPSPSAAIAQTP